MDSVTGDMISDARTHARIHTPTHASAHIYKRKPHKHWHEQTIQSTMLTSKRRINHLLLISRDVVITGIHAIEVLITLNPRSLLINIT